MKKNNFLIIDSSALLYRAFHALPPLINKEGEQMGGVYGFLLLFFKSIKEIKPKFIIACFDHPSKTFRHKKFKEYKAQRPKTPKEIVDQIPKIKKVFKKFNIPILEKEGFEADDLIATVAQKNFLQEDDMETYIMSGDADLFQLVNEKIKVYTLGKGVKQTLIYDKDKIISRFSLLPEQLVDFKALVGDASDNVPGVSGIGKKTATNLLSEFRTLENIYKNLGSLEIGPRAKETLKKEKEKAFLSKELVETKKDVPIKVNLKECKFDFNKKEAEDILREFNFKSLIKRLSSLMDDSSGSQLSLM